MNSIAKPRTIGTPETDVLTIKEAAKLLRCSKPHVSNLLAGRIKGALPLAYIPLGRRKLIRRESLLRWMEQAEDIAR